MKIFTISVRVAANECGHKLKVSSAFSASCHPNHHPLQCLSKQATATLPKCAGSEERWRSSLVKETRLTPNRTLMGFHTATSRLLSPPPPTTHPPQIPSPAQHKTIGDCRLSFLPRLPTKHLKRHNLRSFLYSPHPCNQKRKRNNTVPGLRFFSIGGKYFNSEASVKHLH